MGDQGLDVDLAEKAPRQQRLGRRRGLVDIGREPVGGRDGARVLFGDGWGLLRTSNTQPVIVARFEARTPERLAEIRNLMETWLKTQGIHV